MISASVARTQRLGWKHRVLRCLPLPVGQHIHHDEQPGPHPPSHVQTPQINQAKDGDPRNDAVRARRQRVNNVPAIQLAAGQQVQRSRKHPDPRRPPPSDADKPATTATRRWHGSEPRCAASHASRRRSQETPVVNQTDPSPARSASKDSSPLPGLRRRPQIPRLVRRYRYRTMRLANGSAL